MPRGLDYRVAPDHYLRQINDRHRPQVPDDVFVEQGPKGFHVLKPASNRLDVLLRHRPRSIAPSSADHQRHDCQEPFPVFERLALPPLTVTTRT
jgi:hypothetical protein